ncbi:MAG: SCO family protein [Anaerolineae bacterium]|nr:SCO family protein [Anaerolineae bacterium]
MSKQYLSHLIFVIGISLAITGCQALAGEYTFKGTHLQPTMPLPDFELLDTNGEPFRLSDADGELTLVYFGYTFCPDVCPLTLADLHATLEGLDSREQINVVFISVDPERDTPELVAQYVAAFDPTFIGLTDTPERTQAAMEAFGVFSEKEEAVGSAADYLVTHSSRVFLVNRQGEIEGLYSFDFAPEDLRSDLEFLLNQG